MRSYLRRVVLCLLLFTASTASAHHVVGHGGSSMSLFNPYSSQTRRPDSFLDFSFNVDHLDANLGYVLSYQLAGEYAINRFLSVGGRIPFLSVREKFLPDTDRFGDVAVSVKGLIGEWPLHRAFLNLGTEISFPTGSEGKGTGTGAVMFSPYVTLSKGFEPLSIVVTLGSTLAAENHIRPSIDYATSLIVPIVKSHLPVDFFLSFQGSTTTSSKTFASGSTKAYLRPAFSFHLTEKTLATLGAKVSVVDTLRVKKGIALSRLSTAPLSDVDAGFTFDINYSF